MLRAKPALAVVLATVLGLLGLVTAVALDRIHVGRQPDGSVVLPTDQVITPAGQQLEFPGRPVAVALRPNGRTGAFLTGYAKPVVIANLATHTVLQQLDAGDPSVSFDGIVYSPDGARLYASEASGRILMMSVAGDGTVTVAGRIALPTAHGNPYPGGLAISADGATLYVALSRDNTLGIVDLAGGAPVREIPVGNAPHSVAVSGGVAYVSDQGGRPAAPGDVTNDSSGTAIVADPASGGAATGAISVVDLAAGREVASIGVGLQPTALLLHGDDLFVANTNADTISVIDTGARRVAKTIAVQPFPGAPFGSSPDALAMLGGDRLVVALGRSNALAVYQWQGAAAPVVLRGLVPTGWYPAGLAVAGDDVVVANAKGVGSLGPDLSVGTDPGSTRTGKNVHSNQGSASVVGLGAHVEYDRMTRQVAANNHWDRARQEAERQGRGGRRDVRPVAIPERVGEPSLIRHVFLVVKENRTYDQVLGDVAKGDGDPSLTPFGADVTPNQHALVDRFPLLDNFYASGSLSADGHQWLTQAYVDDYLEKAFGGFTRSYPFNGGDSLAYAPTGFLWQAAAARHRSVAAYGEYANQFAGPAAQFGTWSDWYRDSQILAGQVNGQPHVTPGTFQSRSDVLSLDRILARDFPGYTMAIPDQYRFQVFKRHFADAVRAGDLPSLVMMTLPDDHTAGLATGFPTPRAMMADNDLAVGELVDLVSHSPYWSSSAIFVLEDDAQHGVDHVDGHRTTGYVLSPYARRGAVVSTYYTQIDLVRTIEQILGLPALNQMDLAATPMRDVFTNDADPTPFDAVPNRVPLDEFKLPPTATASQTAAASAWVAESNRMDFDRATVPDLPNEDVLNRAIWYGSVGFDRPYPGDHDVLLPSQVGRVEKDGG